MLLLVLVPLVGQHSQQLQEEGMSQLSSATAGRSSRECS
jgi:hypothetical protein